MELLKLAGLDVRLWQARSEADFAARPLVVLLHGFGAPGDDLVALGRELDCGLGARFLFPAAPIALGPQFFGGRAWWPIDLEQRILRRMRGDFCEDEVPEGLAQARAKVMQLLSEARERFSPSQIVLGGFSQGAMLTLDVTLRSELELAGILLLSGTQLAIDEWRPRMAARAGLSVFMSHGDADEILPQQVSLQLSQMLRDAGLSVSWHSFAGGHGIPPQVLREAQSFLRQVLSSSKT